MRVVVSSRGQIVIPVEARKKMGIKEGDTLLVHIEEGSRLIFKAGQDKRIKKGIVNKTAGILSDMEMSGQEYVESIRKGSDRRLNGLEGSL